jgi:ribosomal protein S18 acetylase RimI-like enzyme
LSELRPESPVRRPQTARPRTSSADEVAAPSAQELEAVARHLVVLPELEGATVTEDEALGVTFVRGAGSGPDLTYAALARWDDAERADRLRAVRRRMLDDHAWPSLLLTDRFEQPLDLPAQLERDGWMPVLSETVMWVGRAAVVPHLDPGIRIEAVRPAVLETHERLEREIFGLGADQLERRRPALAAALDSGRLRAWVVWLGDEPVAVARLSHADGVAGLHGIGVVPSHRGRGYGTLITTIATRTGLATGARIVWLSVHEDNEPAVRAYEALGFERAFGWTRWLVTEDPRRR